MIVPNASVAIERFLPQACRGKALALLESHIRAAAV
jgi:hypothetical protein